jgi:hypothetical protein
VDSGPSPNPQSHPDGDLAAQIFSIGLQRCVSFAAPKSACSFLAQEAPAPGLPCPLGAALFSRYQWFASYGARAFSGSG